MRFQQAKLILQAEGLELFARFRDAYGFGREGDVPSNHFAHSVFKKACMFFGKRFVEMETIEVAVSQRLADGYANSRKNLSSRFQQ